MSNFLKVAQIEVIREGVLVAPKQRAKHLCRNLEHSNPQKRIDPALSACVRSKVYKSRTKLPRELLHCIMIVDSFGSMENLVESRWFSSLLDNHNSKESDFHFDLFEVFIIGKDLNLATI